jgi:hypothetical protein
MRRKNEAQKVVVFCNFLDTRRLLAKNLRRAFADPNDAESTSRERLKPLAQGSKTVGHVRDLVRLAAADGKKGVKFPTSKSRDLEDFCRRLPVYVRRWDPSMNARRGKITPAEWEQYLKDSGLEVVLREYFHVGCDGVLGDFLENLGRIARWSFVTRADRGPVAEFRESSVHDENQGSGRHGKSSGRKHREGGGESLEDLKTAFNSPFFPLALIATKSGSEGINLHKYCANLIHYEQDWMPNVIEQRTGRVDRLYSQAARERGMWLGKARAAFESGRGHAPHVLEPGDSDVEICEDVKSDASRKSSPAPKLNVVRLVIEGTLDEYMYNRERERSLWVELFFGGEDRAKMLDRHVGLEDAEALNDARFMDSLDELIKSISIDLNPRKRRP